MAGMSTGTPRLRSPPLFAAGMLLLAAAGTLAVALEGALPEPATEASIASDQEWRGSLLPAPNGRDSPLSDPAVRDHLGNHTYLLQGGDIPPGAVALVTTPTPVPIQGPVAVRGAVAWSGQVAGAATIVVAADMILPR